MSQMFTKIKKIFKSYSEKPVVESECTCKSLLLKCLLKFLEDILLWRNMWISSSFTLFINIIFIICVLRNINLSQFFIALYAAVLSIDAFEAWLKYKHRISFLNTIAPNDSIKFYQTVVLCDLWIKRKLTEFMILREINSTKAFLLVNIILVAVYVVARSINGYVLAYTLMMGLSFSYLLIPRLTAAIRRIQQYAESDYEIENLIPMASEQEIKEMTYEFESPSSDRQSMDYWKLEDIPAGETSDSSDNSAITNFSKDKIRTLDKDIENSSGSSDDEYIPKEVKEEQLQSTLEVYQQDTWSSLAYNKLLQLSSIMTQPTAPPAERIRTSSVDSSDGFEVIDKSELY